MLWSWGRVCRWRCCVSGSPLQRAISPEAPTALSAPYAAAHPLTLPNERWVALASQWIETAAALNGE